MLSTPPSLPQVPREPGRRGRVPRMSCVGVMYQPYSSSSAHYASVPPHPAHSPVGGTATPPQPSPPHHHLPHPLGSSAALAKMSSPSPARPLVSPAHQLASPAQPLPSPASHQLISPANQLASPAHPLASPAPHAVTSPGEQQLTSSSHQLTSSSHQLTSPAHQLTSPGHQLTSSAHQLTSSTQLAGSVVPTSAYQEQALSLKREHQHEKVKKYHCYIQYSTYTIELGNCSLKSKNQQETFGEKIILAKYFERPIKILLFNARQSLFP